MKSAAPPEFYDRVMDNRHTPFRGPVSASPYNDLYRAVLLAVPRGSSVVELGCGAGQLAKMLRMRARSYVGLDFSTAMIEQARSFWPSGDFRVADLRTDPIPEAETYIATEVLEHLDDDLALIRRLPHGATLVVSVPSFDSESHLRFFPRRGQARTRYEALLAIDTERYIDLPRKTGFFHLLRGKVR